MKPRPLHYIQTHFEELFPLHNKNYSDLGQDRNYFLDHDLDPSVTPNTITLVPNISLMEINKNLYKFFIQFQMKIRSAGNLKKKNLF